MMAFGMIVVLIGFVMLGICIADCIRHKINIFDSEWFIGASTAFLCSAILLIPYMIDEADRHVEYQVMFEDSASIKEVFEEYELVKQEGQIFTTRKKEK